MVNQVMVPRPVVPAKAPPNNGAPGKRYVEDFFIYTLEFLALAAGATDEGTIQIQSDAAFKWTKAAVFTDIGAAALTEDTLPIPLATVQIRDGGSGRLLFSDDVFIETTFGTGQLPFILPIPRIFMQRSLITVSIANLGTDAYNIRFAMIGTKVFPYGGSGGHGIV